MDQIVGLNDALQSIRDEIQAIRSENQPMAATITAQVDGHVAIMKQDLAKLGAVVADNTSTIKNNAEVHNKLAQDLQLEIGTVGRITSIENKLSADYDKIMQQNEVDGRPDAGEASELRWCRTQSNRKNAKV